MTDIRNLMVYKTIMFTCNSDGEPVKGTERNLWLLYNKTQISKGEIEELLKNDGWDCDPRLIEVTPAQMSYLKDKGEKDEAN